MYNRSSSLGSTTVQPLNKEMSIRMSEVGYRNDIKYDYKVRIVERLRDSKTNYLYLNSVTIIITQKCVHSLIWLQ